MIMKQNIAIIYGGDSSEWQISIQSGRHVASNVDLEKYNVYEVLLRGADWSLVVPDESESDSCTGLIDGVWLRKVAQIDKTDFSCKVDGVKVKFDKALIMIHGTPGENGLLQGYFEMMGIPFTTCSSYVSALTFDKYACKSFLRATGIPMPKDIYLRKGDVYSADEIVVRLGLPLFVKPNNEGSSFGISKVKRASDLRKAIEAAFEDGESVLIEECISGRELTEGVYSVAGEVVTLPVTEIVPHNEYFDYEAKYLGESDEICPASLSEAVASKVDTYTRKIYHHFGCRGLVRMDYILRDEEVYFLEINTVPGMTKMSLVPQQLRVAGIGMKDFISTLIDICE
jgi:D-alanine--D-alanine ligase